MVCAVCSAARLSTPAPPEPLPHLYASANQLPYFRCQDIGRKVIAVFFVRLEECDCHAADVVQCLGPGIAPSSATGQRGNLSEILVLGLF